MRRIYYICRHEMVVVAQLVRASVCGTEGRGFETHLPPKSPDENSDFFILDYLGIL